MVICPLSHPLAELVAEEKWIIERILRGFGEGSGRYSVLSDEFFFLLFFLLVHVGGERERIDEGKKLGKVAKVVNLTVRKHETPARNKQTNSGLRSQLLSSQNSK